MKPENKFRTWFVAKLEGWLNQVHPGATLVARKHADYATSGILDMSLTINGVAVWTEFKHIPQCERHRKLDVSELQKVELATYTEAGAPAIVLVGLPLGPRLGYDVAVFKSPVPENVYRNDFRQLGHALEAVYREANVAAHMAANRFVNTVRTMK